MKSKTVLNGERACRPSSLQPASFIHVLLLVLLATSGQMLFAGGLELNQSESIPIDQLGAVAGKQYQGDDLSVTATPDGARLRCVFDRLVAQATPEGLWLHSTVEDGVGERFRVVSIALGRVRAGPSTLNPQLSTPLEATGTVSAANQLVHFLRPGLTEEYSVSVDGVWQDFVITERPGGAGDLRVELALSGAQAESEVCGVRLTVDGSGRALAYSRLRAVDATGCELVARMEVAAATRLAVVVSDANATYPVRIDPTFSDADWVSLNPGIPGANEGGVGAIVVDGTLVSTVAFGAQTDDVSEGPCPDGTGPRIFMSPPTPRAPNGAGASNAPPVLGPLPDRFIHLGESLRFTATATDPDAPPQTLTFALDGTPPAGAFIAPDGEFSWTPLATQAPSTNTVTVQVSDNGTPPLADARPFAIVVAPRPALAGLTWLDASTIQFVLGTVPGRQYQVFYADSLDAASWLPLGPAITATGFETPIPAERGPGPQRFFRVGLVP